MTYCVFWRWYWLWRHRRCFSHWTAPIWQCTSVLRFRLWEPFFLSLSCPTCSRPASPILELSQGRPRRRLLTLSDRLRMQQPRMAPIMALPIGLHPERKRSQWKTPRSSWNTASHARSSGLPEPHTAAFATIASRNSTTIVLGLGTVLAKETTDTSTCSYWHWRYTASSYLLVLWPIWFCWRNATELTGMVLFSRLFEKVRPASLSASFASSRSGASLAWLDSIRKSKHLNNCKVVLPVKCPSKSIIVMSSFCKLILEVGLDTRGKPDPIMSHYLCLLNYPN